MHVSELYRCSRAPRPSGARLLLFALLLAPAGVAATPGRPADGRAGRAAREADSASAAAESVARAYGRGEPAEQVKAWARDLASRQPDAELRSSVLFDLSLQFGASLVTDRQSQAGLRRVIAPVLNAYGREADCAVFLVRSDEPVVGFDSGVALIISTGVVGRARTEGELLGLVAHEVGHGLHAERFVRASRQYELLTRLGLGETPEARRLRAELQKIELECDAFAARTLAALGYDPREYARLLAGIEEAAGDRRRPNRKSALYPALKDRTLLIEQLAGRPAAAGVGRPSELLTTLQERLASTGRGTEPR